MTDLDTFLSRRNWLAHHIFHLIRGKVDTDEVFDFIQEVHDIGETAKRLLELLASEVHAYVAAEMPNYSFSEIMQKTVEASNAGQYVSSVPRK